MRKAEALVSERLGAGFVAFGVGPIAALLVVPAALERFRAEHPHAEVRIVEGFAPALLPRVRDGSLDFAMGPRLAGDLDAAFAFRPVSIEEIPVADGPVPFTVGLFSRSGAPLGRVAATMAKAVTVCARELAP